jgi:hypothetical protein
MLIVDRHRLSPDQSIPSRIITLHLAVTIGTRLGVYDITAPIGEGGMGQVFRARDTRLNRDVALKVLPDLFANDPERLARFNREAQTLASVNHPNIAHLHGLGRAGASRLRTRKGDGSGGHVEHERNDLADALDPGHAGGNLPRPNPRGRVGPLRMFARRIPPALRRDAADRARRVRLRPTSFACTAPRYRPEARTGTAP